MEEDRSSKGILLEIISRIGNAESAVDVKNFLTKLFESDVYDGNPSKNQFKRWDAGKGIEALNYILNRSRDSHEVASIESAIQSIRQEVSANGLGNIGDEELARLRRDADPEELQRRYEECFREEPYLKGNDALDEEGDFAALEDLADPWSYDEWRDEGDEELSRLSAEFAKLLEGSKNNFTGDNYQFFNEEAERRELFEYCAAVAEHLHSGRFADLVIIDRSSRPLYIGVMEYWRRHFPDQKMPGIFFLNPKGFKAEEDLDNEEILQIAMECAMKDDALELPRARHREEIMSDFAATYKGLFKDKEKPVLIFDSCIHSGDTLEPVKKSFEAAGFKDIEIGSVNPTERSSKVKTDFFITRERPEKGCYPFDRDRLIEKTFNRVYSQKNNDPHARARAVRLRQEIKQIITDQLDREEA